MTGSTHALIGMGQAARVAARELARLSTEMKNRALLNIADALTGRAVDILEANKRDIKAGEDIGMDDSLLDRLLLDGSRLKGMAEDVRSVASLRDPIGEAFDQRTLPNGLQVGKRRVPLGVIGVVYESRPNVTVDISAVCLKSGNAVILRGGSDAIHTNDILAQAVRDCIAEAGVPHEAVQFVNSTDRALVDKMLSMKQYIDLMIPRGGADLVRLVRDKAQMPVVAGGIGVCHTYVDVEADIKSAVAIAYNAKVQRPTVCNALDTLLVHSGVAEIYLPEIAREWSKAGVSMHCDVRAMNILGPSDALNLQLATDEDWGREFLSLAAAVRVVDSMDDALAHIEEYGSGHSEAIITENYSKAMRFLDDVDAAVVYVNASTRFTDGAQFGLGTEVAISTDKMHARGPMGLNELTSYKWTVLGTGQVRE